jgi:REP element-mobilizing transposase RayT
MARALRYVPPETLVEVSAKTAQARFLLRPSEEMNRRLVGILARAKCIYGVRIHAVSCLSNHWHALLSVRDALQLSRFMNYVQSNLAKEAGDLHDWRGPFWGDRYHHVVVTGEPEIQHRRLAYVLGQGAKEGLVARPELWPGVHSVFALRDGEALRGIWYDRTGLCLAGRSKHDRSTLDDFASEEILRSLCRIRWTK